MTTNNPSLLVKIKSRGFTWLFARLLEESDRPASFIAKMTAPAIKLLYYLLLAPIHKAKACLFRARASQKKTLYLFYDLEVSPITYNFCWALTIAEHYRIKAQLDSIQVVFVPGKNQGLRQEDADYERKVNQAARHWRKREILFGLTDLLPSCAGFTFCASRNEAMAICENAKPHIYPKRYSATFPIPHSSFEALAHQYPLMTLRATKTAMDYLRQWLAPRLSGRQLIVITLRQSSYMPVRNSNIQAWANFAASLDPQHYFVVCVPDTEAAMTPPPKALQSFTFFTAACWNVNLRAALYETAQMNLGVNNGVMALCWLNKNCRYITFKIQVDGAPQTSEKSHRKQGIRIGESLLFATQYQQWVWADDDEHTIQQAFHKMMPQPAALASLS